LADTEDATEMVRVEVPVLYPDPSCVKVTLGAVPMMPGALDDVNDTVPLKPLKPCALIVVEESELPAEIVTLVWLRVMLKPAGAIFTGMVTEWVLRGCGGLRTPSPVAVTVTDPVLVPLQVRVSLPVPEGVVRSTVGDETEHARPAVLVVETSRMSW